MNSDIIKRPLITEKAVLEKETRNCYAFEVARSANKHLIRRTVEEAFQVKVSDVRTMLVRGKVRRIGRHFGQRPKWKKAIVTIAAGQKIEIFETK